MTFLKTISASIIALIVATSCSDESFDGNVEYNERITFSVSPLDWYTVSNNAAEGNAVHTKCNIPNSNYSIETIVEPTPDVEVAPKTKATAITTESLQDFNVTAVVTDNSGNNPSLMMKDQEVSHSSGLWTYSPVKYWPNNNQYTTTFYAYRTNDFTSQTTESDGCTPVLSYTVPTDPTEQKDLIAARYTNNDYGTVNFQLQHLLTAIKIKTKNIKRPILRIEFTGIYQSGDYHLSTMSWSNIGTPGDFKYSFVGSQLIGSSDNNGAYVKDNNESEIYLMMLPQNLADNSNASIKILFDNGTVLQAPLTTNWEEGKTVTYVVSYDKVSCQWLEDSNSYIISPVGEYNNNVNLFAIPISYRINTFWQNEGGGVKPITSGTEYVAEVIWQDSPTKVISFTDASGNSTSGTYSAKVPEGSGDNEYVYFKLEGDGNFNSTSNVVVGVRKKGESTYLWSWHLWITPYYPIPNTPQSLTSAVRVEVKNGSIERYDDSNLPNATSNWDKLPNRYLMDRNIGAKGSCNVEITEDNYKKTFGMYYQFGRKDPFLPNGKLYKMKSDGIIETLGELTTDNASLIVPATKNIPFNGTDDWPVVKTVQYPMEFVVSNEANQHTNSSGNWRNPNWYAAGNTPGSKSFYDPCPPGWRVPNGTIFNVFGQKYNSTKSFVVDEDKRLKIGDQVVGNKYYIDNNTSLTTNYYIWSHRLPSDGRLYDTTNELEGNTLIWRSESFKIFQLFIHWFDGTNIRDGYTEMDNTCNRECYGAQVRAIHE